MSSKTILIGLSIFRFGGEKSVLGRPSWELAPYDCSSQNTVMKILARGVNFCRRNAASMIALESAEWFDLQHNFLFWTRPKHSLLESELLVFSVTPFKIGQNKNQNHSTDKVQNLGNERR